MNSLPIDEVLPALRQALQQRDEAVLEALDSHSIRQIEDAPAARCAGCFGLRFSTVNANNEEVVFEAHGMDFGGRFTVRIHKME